MPAEGAELVFASVCWKNLALCHADMTRLVCGFVFVNIGSRIEYIKHIIKNIADMLCSCNFFSTKKGLPKNDSPVVFYGKTFSITNALTVLPLSSASCFILSLSSGWHDTWKRTLCVPLLCKPLPRSLERGARFFVSVVSSMFFSLWSKIILLWA